MIKTSCHPPSVFVSSTCYDLAQVRNDLHSFLRQMGMVPVLSESPSFPVHPSLGTIENCLVAVKENADIFILVIGGRYGSVAGDKSVTNLEYLEAKAKNIPCYVFVQKPILTAFSIWQKNPTGDFSGIVDSTNLFEFVKSLHDSKENWVFPFESAQDIIVTLHSQLAYLFTDALEIRRNELCSGLPGELIKDLSGAALRLAIQKPKSWEFRLFGQVLSDEISRLASIKRDYAYGLAFGKIIRLRGISELNQWIIGKFDEMNLLLKSTNALFVNALPKAVGAPGEPGNVEEIVYVARRLAEFYLRILEWTSEFRHVIVEDKYRRLLELTSQMSRNAVEEIEEYPIKINQQINDAERQFHETNERQSVNLVLKLTMPDRTEFSNELDRLKREIGL